MALSFGVTFTRSEPEEYRVVEKRRGSENEEDRRKREDKTFEVFKES
jgi:hypothetical protein